MGRAEFIALMAMMVSIVAFSIDSMLPSLPQIGIELVPQDPARASLVLTSFVLGMGLGTFVSGPLSDALGRRPVIFIGAGLYCIASAVAWAAPSLEIMLAARLVQGLGASGPRIVSLAIMRDLFTGREMARIVSIVMIFFTIVPALAPALGLGIIALFGWRAIFLSFIVFSLISVAWLGLRLPETLPRPARRPLRFALLLSATQQMFAHPSVRISILVQSLALAMLFSILMLIQPIFAQTFGRAESFPFWFGLIALCAGSSSFLNAMLVVRLGMRRLVTFALGVQIALSGLMLALAGHTGDYSFPIFLIWQFFLFFQAGLTLGNLNAIAMEPMGHIAGMAASVIGAISTVCAAAIASPIGMMFDGTTSPLVLAVLIMATLGYGLMLYMSRLEHRMPPAKAS
jgi:DHA1 family bicyclomycin/chloramphenicol resistance-like MFS transporter